MSNEDRDEISSMINKAYKNGTIEGIKMYSWMKNGVAYVGTAGKTLKTAIEEIEKEFRDLES